MASVEPIVSPTVSITTTALLPSGPNVVPRATTVLPNKDAGSFPSTENASLISEAPCLMLTSTEVCLKPETPLPPASGVSPLKKPRHKPDERKELLLMAVKDVIEHNISMRKAASRYNLAKSSLCDFVRKRGIKLPNNRCKQPTTALTSELSTDEKNGLQSCCLQRKGEASGLLGLTAETWNLLRAQQAVTTTPVAGPFSRLESPWNNVSGLPTQVPMQNWSSLATVKPQISVPQPTTTSSTDPMIVHAEAHHSPSTTPLARRPAITNESNYHLFASRAFNSSSVICNPAVVSLHPPTTTSVSQLPAPPSSHSTTTATKRGCEQLIPVLHARSSIASTQAPSQVPLVFPTNNLSTASPAIVDSLHSIILTAAAAGARVEGKQFLLPENVDDDDLGDLLLDDDIPISMTTATDVLLQKLQIPNRLSAVMGGPFSSQTHTPPHNAIARLPQSPMTHAKELISFINKSPSPFHAVRSACEILTNNGFRELRENDSWSLRPNDCVFVTKNRSSLFAIAVGGAYEVGEGFGIIAAHTDSPCLRLKPISERVTEGFVELAVQTYGGGLWYTWFDRDLTLAGRCIVRNADTGALTDRLVHINRPLVCVPSLAIHLNREANKAFAPNPEVHLAPILCTTLTEQLYSGGDGSKSSAAPSHPASLLRLIAAELQCSPSELVELELYLADTQPASIGGIHEEFIHAPRLDNQFCAYTSVQAMVDSLPSLKDDRFVRVVCLYDHEEIGSRSMHGANSIYTASLFRRIIEALSLAGNPEVTAGLFERTMARSFLVSADQAHAVHPSWPEKHEKAHKPGFHQGMVLKHNCSQSYATNGITSAIIKEVARRCQVPLQEFVTRQDERCGGTIGSILASQLGVMTADVGGAQLAMHSCREMTCTTSVNHAIALFAGFFENVATILNNLSIK